MSGRVVHRNKEPFDVYIGRPSKWGNPIKITNSTAKERDRVLNAYRALINSGYLADQLGENWRQIVIKELKGKTLACWCAPLPCHGDILKELADNDCRPCPVCSELVCGLRNNLLHKSYG